MYGYGGTILFNTMSLMSPHLGVAALILVVSIFTGLFAAWMIHQVLEPLDTTSPSHNEALLGRSLAFFSIVGIVMLTSVAIMFVGIAHAMGNFN